MPDSCLKVLHNKIVKSFGHGLMTSMILIDLQEAFEKIDHETLLKKLTATGFSNNNNVHSRAVTVSLI